MIWEALPVKIPRASFYRAEYPISLLSFLKSDRFSDNKFGKFFPNGIIESVKQKMGIKLNIFGK
jgi:hypothetical protein